MSVKISSVELQRNFGSVMDRARTTPVIVTKHDRPSVVMLPVEEYQRLLRGYRRSYRISAMSGDKVDRIMGATLDPELEQLNDEMK